MARPRFSEMLVDRRRQLGLSIAQASQVLRLKQQVLMAFEEGDFANMPKSGYAQGMLSSYARYLGLNTRVVVSQFTSDLFEHERGRGAAPVRRRRYSREEEVEYELPRERPGHESYEGGRGLLPTSGGYAGDLGSFATTSPPRSRNVSSPLVSQRGRGYGGGGERRYTGRDVPSYGTRAKPSQARPRLQDPSGYPSRYTGAEGRAERAGRDSVLTRRVGTGEYVDDLRYDDARPYEAASTTSGRRSSRNIANVDRPNVQRRRKPRDADRRGRPRRRQPRRGGIVGLVEEFFSDGRRTMILVSVLAVIILTVIIITSVSSCVSAKATSGRTVSVSTSSDTGGSDPSGTPSNGSAGKSDEAAEAAKEAAEAKEAQKQKEANTETRVEVSVADGEVTWLEIEVDGTSVVAEQVTGPWDNSYTVTESMTVQVSNTTAVTVTKNGTTQKFDSKTSGIGTLTIQGTKPSPTDATAEATSSDGETSGASADASDETAPEGAADTTSAATASASKHTTGGPKGSGDPKGPKSSN